MSNKRHRNAERNNRKKTLRAWKVTMQESYPHHWPKGGVVVVSEKVIENIRDIMFPLIEAVREYIKLPEPFFLDANEIQEGSGLYVGQVIHPEYGVIAVSHIVDNSKDLALYRICKNIPIVPTVSGQYLMYKESTAHMHVAMRKRMEEKANGKSNGF